MRTLLLALGVLVAGGPAPDPLPEPRPEPLSEPIAEPYSGLLTNDMDELASILRTRVATLDLTIKPREDMLVDPVRVVFGIVVDARTVATVAQLCVDAETIVVQGPKGRLPGRIRLVDLERRVALVRTDRPLSDIGLVVSKPLAPQDRREYADVFALVNTDPGAGVLQGVLTQVGRQPEYEGHPRTSLVLSFGMPVFDGYTRWVGYARTVAWDNDRQMLIPPDKVRLARTSTAMSDRPSSSAPEKPTRPWWAR